MTQMMTSTQTATPKTSGFACMECGKKFRSMKAAERASSEGCPKCGGVDVDLVDPSPPVVKAADTEQAG